LFGAVAGQAVELLQEALRREGHDPGNLDGIYGAYTARAVRAFQESHGLPPDGVVGRQTWELLGDVAGWSRAEKSRYSGVLHGAVQGEDVRAAQRTLGARGFDPGTVDGVFGPMTERAVLGFQEEHGLETTGVVDEATWAALGLPADAPRSWFPGYAADSIAGEDLLGIGERVDFLSSVLAAKRLETPLAIGIFGDWGSGKSFFMNQLADRIDTLVEHSAAAEKAREETFFCSHVRQVTFNAWLYAGGDMLASLAAQVFRRVSGEESEAPQGEAQAQAFGTFQKQAADRLRALDDERNAAEAGEAALDRQIEAIAADIAAKRVQAAELAAPLGTEATAVARTVAVAQGGRHGRLREAWRVMSARERATLLGVVAVGAVVAIVAAVDSVWLATALGVAVPVAAILGSSLRYVDETARARLEIADLERRAEALQAERDRLATERRAAEQSVDGFRARPVLPQFAAQQAARWTALSQPGTTTEIRLRFEQLSALISENLQARATGHEPPEDVPPIERIIVYVDDLDRCEPPVVVNVLEAIKLLLALPHFVVIVGVDSRWLFRSLEMTFAQMLDERDGLRLDTPGGTTPQNYLEKIFQYSLVLRPMTPEGFERLVRGILPVERPLPDVDVRPMAEPIEDGTTAPNGDAPQPPSPGPPPSEAKPDLAPRDLVFTEVELEAIVRLAPMFGTPRAAKRLTNLYRLIRVAVGADRVLEDEAYQPLLLLLAVSLAYPTHARDFFRALSGRSSLDAILAGPSGQEEGSPPWGEVLPGLTVAVSQQQIGNRPSEDFTPWLSTVAEFSFHAWRDVQPTDSA
jgi:peptidoglycan hydrolase-like protein with peptidoglycan-binding domain